MIVQTITDDLVYTYSDTNHYIIQNETGLEYIDACDSVTSTYTYSESEDLIPEDLIPERKEETDLE